MNILDVPVSFEGPRGCGYRKAGGIYLVADGAWGDCGRLPLLLKTCPCCGAGIKPARGWTWVEPALLFQDQPCRFQFEGQDLKPCRGCNLGQVALEDMGRAGLLWIGERFYNTPADWLREAKSIGASRRISRVPRGFEVGKTWVLMGHRKAGSERCTCWPAGASHPDPACDLCEGGGGVPVPGIVAVFLPRALEYVVNGDESEEELARLVDRGLTPVRVMPRPDDGPGLFDAGQEGDDDGEE